VLTQEASSCLDLCQEILEMQMNKMRNLCDYEESSGLKSTFFFFFKLLF
jgi:hypothetical protein